jgi:integration host factor subunit alpha
MLTEISYSCPNSKEHSLKISERITVRISGEEMSLTKTEIVENLVKIGFNRKKAVQMLENLLEIIKRDLENGEDVLISGFGKFSIKNKKERRGRNPATGDDLILGKRKVITFNCSSVLRERFNK